MADWDDLRFFLAVARHGTLSGAARALAVDQTTVGRRLSALEGRTGAALFARAQTGVTLTAAGRRMLPRAETAERAMLEFERDVAGEDQRLSGVVKLAMSAGMGTGFLVRHLGGLHARHPEIDLELMLGSAQVNLVRREADLAVRIGARGQAELVGRKLASIGWALYASAGYLARHGRPRLGDGLVGHNVIAFVGDIERSPGATWLQRHATRARAAARCNDLVAVVHACAAGLGVAPLPVFLTREASLERLSPDVLLAVDAWLMMHRAAGKIARVRAVAEFLTELFRVNAAWIGGD